MRKYETLLLLSPELPGDDRKTIVDGLTGIIEREQGQILEVDDWGMKNLAYPVNKVMRGYYVRLEYAAQGPVVQELERNIRITEGVFKFVTVQLEKDYQPEEVQ